ncbi:MAG: GNAT family N-acetyltransferase [Methanomassiliicoccales archaeon]|jgi:ribosomal protein S18 acetylase RimI-like enzyme
MHGPGLKIRKAGREDYNGIISLWTRAGLHYQPTGRDSRANLDREMADPEVDMLVAFARDWMIGSVIATNDGRKGWVNRLAVDPDHRGKGVARALIEEVKECFKARSLKIFSCLIYAENESSQSLFRKDRIRPSSRGRVLFQEDRPRHLSHLYYQVLEK